MTGRPRKGFAKRTVRRRPARPARRQSRPVPQPLERLHNLPTQLSNFIGREAEIAGIKRLLETTRLLTLTGSGGCGKTRLALEMAASSLQQYADGVWLVELAALADPAVVPHTVAAALDVPEQPTRSLDQNAGERSANQEGAAPLGRL